MAMLGLAGAGVPSYPWIGAFPVLERPVLRLEVLDEVGIWSSDVENISSIGLV